MKNFVDAWKELKSKGYKHLDGTEVLNDNDRESVTRLIREHVEAGIAPQEAARLAIQTHLDEVETHLKEIEKQTGGEKDAQGNQSPQDVRSNPAYGSEQG